MKKIFIKSLNQLIEFDLPLKKIKFNSKNNYRQLTFNINDEIVFSINNEIFDISKFGLIIQNPFCISLNEKKLLNSLYKELEEKKLRKAEFEAGREAGHEAGFAEGENHAALEIASRMLQSDKFSLDEIANFSGLSIAEVKKLCTDKQ